MGSKRFRTIRLWHNALMMVWAIPFIVLPGVIAGASTGKFLSFWITLVLSLVGLFFAARQDSRKSAVYSVEDECLVLTTPQLERKIMVSDISDTSLLDRMGARAYVKAQAEPGEPGAVTAAREAEFMRFCTVDIGLSTYTLGAIRSLIDRLPSAKRDLVLLRLRGGEVLLLSPVYAHDLVDTLGRRRTQR